MVTRYPYTWAGEAAVTTLMTLNTSGTWALEGGLRDGQPRLTDVPGRRAEEGQHLAGRLLFG